jgi:hypothetical protein
MRLSPDGVEFSIANDRATLISVNGVFEQEEWRFKEFELTNDYVGAVAYGPGEKLLKQLTFRLS